MSSLESSIDRGLREEDRKGASMFRSWIEIRAYMIDRQRELIRMAGGDRDVVLTKTPKDRPRLLRRLLNPRRRP